MTHELSSSRSSHELLGRGEREEEDGGKEEKSPAIRHQPMTVVRLEKKRSSSLAFLAAGRCCGAAPSHHHPARPLYRQTPGPDTCRVAIAGAIERRNARAKRAQKLFALLLLGAAKSGQCYSFSHVNYLDLAAPPNLAARGEKNPPPPPPPPSDATG